jgi:hypothetical protein
MDWLFTDENVATLIVIVVTGVFAIAFYLYGR